MAAVRGVYLSDTLDLEHLFGAEFEAYSDALILSRPEDVTAPEEVAFALAWNPGDDAFARFPNITLVSSIAAGVDSILKCPSLPANAQIMRIRDPEQARHMAGFGLWHVIGAHREMDIYARQQARSQWLKHPYRPASETRVSILGLGLMGATLARSLVALGYDVTGFAKFAPDPPIPGVKLVTETEGKIAAVRDCHICVDLLPGTEETRGILDRALFDAMAPGATLINLSRGDHLVEADLLAALSSGQLRSAALDVAATEPLPPDHPFWRHPAIRITPHVAAESPFSTVARLVVEDVQRMQNGDTPVGMVDRELGF